MNMNIKYKVALLGCLIIVSVAAAMTVPGVYNTIKTFITALDKKDVTELIKLSDPMSALPHQMDDVNQIITESKIELVSLYTDVNDAIAVTTEIIIEDTVYDEGYTQGPLVITLIRKDNVWLVTDIDIETQESALEEIVRFMEKHPNAVEIIPE